MFRRIADNQSRINRPNRYAGDPVGPDARFVQHFESAALV